MSQSPRSSVFSFKPPPQQISAFSSNVSSDRKSVGIRPITLSILKRLNSDTFFCFSLSGGAAAAVARLLFELASSSTVFPRLRLEVRRFWKEGRPSRNSSSSARVLRADENGELFAWAVLLDLSRTVKRLLAVLNEFVRIAFFPISAICSRTNSVTVSILPSDLCFYLKGNTHNH